MASDCRQAKDSLQSLSGAAADILKQTQIDYVKKDPHDFCQRNMLLRGLNANGVTPPNVDKISTDELKEKYAEKILANSDFAASTGWEHSLIPTYENRNFSFGTGTRNINFDLASGTFSSPPAYTVHLSCPIGQIEWSQTACIHLPPVHVPEEATAKKLAACAEMTFWHSKECMKGLSFIQSNMAPVLYGGTTLMPPQAWSQVLGETKYDEGLRLAALKIIERTKGKITDKNANIFSDLQDAFKKSGMSTEDAKQSSFDVLGLIGSASANLAARFYILGLSTQKTKALGLISAALPLLDYQKSTEGKGTLYSLPGSVISTCDNAKTYHFWLAAYISRTLVKENGVSTSGAAYASFVAEKGYQVNRELAHETDKRGNAHSIITKPPYDPVQQVQRMDLNFAAAGAEFGAQSVKSSTDLKLNLDQSLASMIENSNVTPPVSKEEAKGMGFVSSYLKWEKEVSPNTALEAIQKQMNP